MYLSPSTYTQYAVELSSSRPPTLILAIILTLLLFSPSGDYYERVSTFLVK
jgi:hypothetical protein